MGFPVKQDEKMSPCLNYFKKNGGNNTIIIDMSGYKSLSIRMNGINSANLMIFICQVSNDGTNWTYQRLDSVDPYPLKNNILYALSATRINSFVLNKTHRFVKFTTTFVIEGFLHASFTLNDFTIPIREFDYKGNILTQINYITPAGGVTTTGGTAFSIFGAGSPRECRSMTHFTATNAGANDTELTFRSAPAATEMCRFFIKAGQTLNIDFTPFMIVDYGNGISCLPSASTTIYLHVQGLIFN